MQSLRFLVAILSCLFIYKGTNGQGNSQNVTLQKIGVMPKILKETSGLEVTSPNSLWSHNDDTYPYLYNIDSTGQLIKAIYLNHQNSGWEDLAQDYHGNIYIGAFGNNTNTRKDLKIYKIGNPDSIKEKFVNAGIIDYHYSDQKLFPPDNRFKNFDMDAMISVGDSLYLFSKNRTAPFDGYTKVYRLPNTPGTHQADLVDSIFLCNESMLTCWVTAADISPDKKHLVLLSHDKLWLISCFEGSDFGKGKIQQISLNHFSHKAAICFYNDHQVYITDELEMDILGGKLYRLDLGPWLKVDCN